MLVINLKKYVLLINLQPLIMQVLTTIITTFIFCGPNLSKESTTHVNTIATHQQNRL
jgi:hypothetical protein